jgi:hypothetical protein
MRDTKELKQQVGRIDALVQKLESSADPSTRGTALDLVQSLMEFHGAGLERILEIVSTTGGDAGAELVQSLAHDELVSSLLVLYGLHPEDFEARVRRGLDKVRPLLRSRGAGLEVIAIAGGSSSPQNYRASRQRIARRRARSAFRDRARCHRCCH